MKLISSKDFIEKFGADEARLIVSHRFYKEGCYYCHIYKQGSITMKSTYSNKPNIQGAEWVNLSELNKTLAELKEMQ